MRRAEPIAIAVLLGLPMAQPADAASRAIVSIRAGTLGDAVATLGAQASVSIGMVDPLLQGLAVEGLRGRLTVERALTRLLRGMPARAERVDAASWRIVRKPVAVDAPIRRASSGNVAPMASADIVVTASKRDTTIGAYSGTAYLLNGSDLAGRGHAAGTDAVLARLPTLAATALGPGRNKLFIRGIADSSFNGPSQATIGEYLGDVRLNYNAPDPNLTLVDIESVEVLEGPQGTLYGAATLGGVVRIVPTAPRTDRFGAAFAGGLATTAHGAGGSDLTGVLNIPLLAHEAALRAVAYRSVDGGYIDDPGRGLTNINRTVTSGGRAMLRLRPDDWTIDFGGAYQATNSADGQYAERGVGTLARNSRIAQPFDNDYGLASFSATKGIGRTTVHVSAGIVAQDLDSRFDFTPPGGAPTAFDESNRIRLLSGEASVARRTSDGVGWIVGVSAFHNEERLTRSLGPLPAPARILGVRNQTTNVSAFVEAGIRLTPTLVATAGGRLDFAHLVGDPLDQASTAAEEPTRNEVSVLPSVGITWRPAGGPMVFARYQEGFRPGGLSVSGSGGTRVQRFEGDSLAMVELGARFTDLFGSGFDGGITFSHAHWEDIQADLVDAGGLPFTANVGNGRIYGIEAQVRRRIVTGLRGELSVFVNKSRLTQPVAFLIAADNQALPNVAKAGGRAALSLDMPISNRLGLTADASVRYVGHSRLAVGPTLDIPQGDYFDTGASARIGTERFGLSLSLSNLLDARGNRFALGNPFDVAAGRQTVPMRPRTIRIGFDAHF